MLFPEKILSAKDAKGREENPKRFQVVLSFLAVLRVLRGQKKVYSKPFG
jgi:hypothetical protein